MGGLVSKAKLILRATMKLGETYDLIQERLNTPPGFPVSNPTVPLWTHPAAQLPVEPPDSLPEHADVVVVGSGITGTSFAYNLLALDSRLKIVMLEAREACSGATARNGGHINPPLYHDHAELRELYGERAANAMIAFRRAHIAEMLRVASQEDILKESQCRETEHLDVYTCPTAFAEAKDNLAKWRERMPAESSTFVSYEREEAIEKFRLSDQVVGCISNSGGAMHPYRFVTSLLSILLSRHPDNFKLYTHLPCVAVLPSDSDYYTVHTPAGSVSAHHVIHATNGWCAELLRPLLGKIAPARGNMSAQRPGRALHPSTLAGTRSFVFYRGGHGPTYDYLTQLPAGEHELMFGGAWGSAGDERDLPEIGLTDDSLVNHAAQSYLAGALPQYFGMANWGRDADAPEHDAGGPWALGRTKAQWSGILAISADILPWVGRLPEQVSGRTQVQPAPRKEAAAHTAAPGEWIAAGYTGEGMVHAWMSGKALAYMVADREEDIRDWFPDILRVTEKRWKAANMAKLFEQFM
ncbi:FAD dependent oxidoreductase [Daedaleopsis nitida]|nr:FAD dependent oxidoreductase [Daedaleopsis nitida]